MSLVNSAEAESQIENVVNKYSNCDFGCHDDNSDESQRIDNPLLNSVRKRSDSARRAGLTRMRNALLLSPARATVTLVYPDLEDEALQNNEFQSTFERIKIQARIKTAGPGQP